MRKLAAFALLIPAIALAAFINIGGNGRVSSSSSDSTPNAFSFTDQTSVALSSTITSAGVTISGIDTSITCSATGGTLDVGADGTFSSSRSVSNNNSIRARHTSSGSNSTATNTVVDCGTGPVSDTFTSTTLASGGSRLVGDEYFAMDLDSSGDGPTYGFNSYACDGGSSSSNMAVTYNSTGGPANRPYITQTVDMTSAHAGDEFNCRFSTNPYSTAEVSWGDTIYYRVSIRIPSITYAKQKFAINAPNGLGDNRVIFTVEDWGAGYRLRVGKDGGDDICTVPYDGADCAEYSDDVYTSTSWRNVQIRVTFSSSSVATDGSYAIWVDNDTFASPSGEVTGINVQTSGSSDVLDLSGYIQNLSVGTDRTWHWTDARVGPTFDSSWHSSGT